MECWRFPVTPWLPMYREYCILCTRNDSGGHHCIVLRRKSANYVKLYVFLFLLLGFNETRSSLAFAPVPRIISLQTLPSRDSPSTFVQNVKSWSSFPTQDSEIATEQASNDRAVSNQYQKVDRPAASNDSTTIAVSAAKILTFVVPAIGVWEEHNKPL